MERDGQNFFVILDQFLPFCPHINPKNQNFEKMKKNAWKYHQFFKCIKNHDHMLQRSSDATYDGCNFYFLFLANFCPFTPLTTQKPKFFKK